MLNCFIIDDEALAIKVIESHLALVPAIEISGTFTNAIEAFEALQHTKVDLLFLDIQMPGLSGFSLLSALPNPPLVILTTAHREFAVESYNFRVIDYLLKPVSFERFMIAIGKAIQILNLSLTITPQPVVHEPERPSFIYIKSERQFIKIWINAINYIESLRNHVRLFTDDGNYVTLVSISDMELKLPSQHFLRIHKSYIIAAIKVTQFTATHVWIGEQVLPIGQVYQERVKYVLSQHVIG